jgi:hypothetical protein
VCSMQAQGGSTPSKRSAPGSTWRVWAPSNENVNVGSFFRSLRMEEYYLKGSEMFVEARENLGEFV